MNKNERNSGSNSPRKSIRSRTIQRLRQSGGTSSSGDTDRTGETGSSDRELGGDGTGTGNTDGDNGEPNELERGTDSENRGGSSTSPDSVNGSGGRTTRRRTSNGNRSTRDTPGTGEKEEQVLDGATWRSPSNLSFDSLHTSDTKGKKTLTAKKHKTVNRVDIEGLQAGFQLMFKVPPMFLGKDHKEHWNLEDTEAEELATTFVKALGETDNKNLKLILEFLTKYMPILTFLACFYIVTSTRIEDSTRLINERKRAKSGVSGVNGNTNTEPEYSSPGTTFGATGSNETHQEAIG